MSGHFNTASSNWKLSLSLLKEATITLHTSDGVCYRVSVSPNAKRIQLLAYLAWKRDQKVPRSELLYKVLCPGLDEKEAAKKKLKDKVRIKFDTHKGLLRRDIRAVVQQLNTERTTDLLPTDFNLFEHDRKHYWLSSLWQVTDLETVETQASVIQEAEQQSKLSGLIPEYIKVACDAVIAAYSGDFLEEMLRMYPEEFQPLETSWVREPYTLYRDYYLQALWYAAQYEWQRREHPERAAKLFQSYAMYACNSRLDTDVYFDKTKKRQTAFRVSMSEDAICRSLVIYKERRRRQEFEACKQAYFQQMEQISGGIWKPDNKLQEIAQSVNW